MRENDTEWLKIVLCLNGGDFKTYDEWLDRPLDLVLEMIDVMLWFKKQQSQK